MPAIQAVDAIIGFDSVVGDCDATRPVRGFANDQASDDALEAIFAAGTNNDLAFAITLTNAFVNGANETAVPAFDATALSSFFTASTFIGGVESNLSADFGDWTCNSAAADFGSATGACTSLPVY